MNEKNTRMAFIKEFAVRGIKFGLVGILNTLIGLGVFYILIQMGMYYVAASFIGFVFGFLNSFLFNKFWTFRSSKQPWLEFLFFCLVAAAAYLVQLAVLVFLKEVVKLQVLVAQLISMVFYTGTGFLGNNFLTFRNKR